MLDIFPMLLMLTATDPVVVTANRTQTPPDQPAIFDALASQHVDYPQSSLERGEEGRVNFLVEIDTKNRIRSCQVAKSSGYATLDRATCDSVIKNGRFTLDERGERQAGGRARLGTMAWVLPPLAKRPEQAPPHSSAKQIARAGQKIVCKYSYKAGSNIIRVKQCHTAAQWAKAEDMGRDEATRLTGGGQSTASGTEVIGN